MLVREEPDGLCGARRIDAPDRGRVVCEFGVVLDRKAIIDREGRREFVRKEGRQRVEPGRTDGNRGALPEVFVVEVPQIGAHERHDRRIDLAEFDLAEVAEIVRECPVVRLSDEVCAHNDRQRARNDDICVREAIKLERCVRDALSVTTRDRLRAGAEDEERRDEVVEIDCARAVRIAADAAARAAELEEHRDEVIEIDRARPVAIAHAARDAEGDEVRVVVEIGRAHV